MQMILIFTSRLEYSKIISKNQVWYCGSPSQTIWRKESKVKCQVYLILEKWTSSLRQSLAVTGQNIANVNTDGFKEVGLEEVSGAGGGVTEISDQTGLGVRVDQIRRAFDEFLIDKARQSRLDLPKANSFPKR